MSRTLVVAGALLVLAGAAAGDGADPRARKLVVLGIDGMDPELLRRFMAEGIAPNLARLEQRGGFIPLGTSIPPQSPVAWSNFITGMDPGGHGIFDFIGLDRDALAPYLSTARVEPPSRGPLAVGDWRIPLGAERTVSLRHGPAFWDLLERNGVPTTMVRIPANYPPLETGGRALSGMGTPDLGGTPGTFTYFTDDPGFEPGPVSGGHVTRVSVRDHTVRASLEGPPNALRAGAPAAEVGLVVHVDPLHPVAEVRIDGERVLLAVGEWSRWVPVRFPLLPGGMWDVPGMVRFYLKETFPRFKLYASPVNIDPGDPAQAIATPEEYASELRDDIGRFYTQEMPEDTKALTHHVLSPREFLAQSGLVLEERAALLRRELGRFSREQKRGLLFFYFSSIDQRSHMLWRQMDGDHPYHDTGAPPDVAGAVRASYGELDALVGEVTEALDQDTLLVVMSDHGFAPFRHQAHLNTWLERNGYLTLASPERRDRAEWLQGLDWARTRAFAIGLNSLYLNVRGRERHGVVSPAEREALAREIAAKLETWRDPASGARVVTRAALREDVYHGPHVAEAPDILVGYARGYRASWATTTAKVPDALIEPNDREWSGDHCMDSRAVPGVLLASRPLARAEADLRDLTVSILAEFGVEAPPEMRGRPVF